jgi:hypothetical protein
MKLAAHQPRQEVKVERSFTCLPAGCPPEAWGTLLHRLAPLPLHVLAAWRGHLRLHGLQQLNAGCLM